MIFESINYSFLLQDFLFAMAAGFAVGGINQLVSVFLYGGRIRLFIKDILICTIFAVAVFSYVVSFANYPVMRIYHIAGAFCGFRAFNIEFSKKLQNIFEKNFLFLKHKMLWMVKKCKSTICAKAAKRRAKRQKLPPQQPQPHLKNDDSLVYTL